MSFLAVAAPILGMAGSALSAGGAVLGGVAAGNAASYQAKVAENSAQIAKQNATYAEQAGGAKAQQAGLADAEQAGVVKTSLAANNVDVNSGSAKDVESATASKGDLNQETIANNAELEAYGYQSAATSDQAQAGLDKATAAEAPIGADIGAMGSLLSSASGLSSKWTGAAAMPVNLNGSGYTVNPDGSGFAVGQ